MLLLTPGPVATDARVRRAFACDYAPWDPEFRRLTARLTTRLLRLAQGDPDRHVVLPLQGCGHFAVEAALRSFLAPGDAILVFDTGDYARHMARAAREAGRRVTILPTTPGRPIVQGDLERVLMQRPDITHVGLVYCETGNGSYHDVAALGDAARKLGRRTIIDAISAFGALPLDIARMPEADAVVFTSNKCLEGMPGLAFVISPIDRVSDCQGRAGSWSLDLGDVYRHGQGKPPGTFRFTPSPQAVAALDRALDLLEAEGGIAARLERYRQNMLAAYLFFSALDLQPYLPLGLQSPIAVSVMAPASPRWCLQRFVGELKGQGILISNFYNTPDPSFRVGCMGAIAPAQYRAAIEVMGRTLKSSFIA